MTPKEKAIELVEKYTSIINEETDAGDSPVYGQEEAAKACAIICVDAIIKVLDEISLGESGTTKIDYGQSYFQKVKEEIQKL